MKRLGYLLLLVICVLSFSSCHTSQPSIIGYWMDHDGYTLSFIDEENCSVNDIRCSYYLYAENRLQFLYPDGITEDCTYELTSETLKLQFADVPYPFEYTNNVDLQKKIIENIQEQLQYEIDFATKQQQIQDIQSQIDIQLSELNYLNDCIENNQYSINNAQQNIQRKIAECEASIIAGGNREYHENLRNDSIAAYNETIQAATDRILELEQKRSVPDTEIERLQALINDLS